MLMQSKHLISQDKKKPPFYVVVQVDKKDGSKIYVKHYGVEKFPAHGDDSIVETTTNRCEALMLCRKKDAQKIAQLCTFKCNCGAIHHVGKLIRVTMSGRKKDGVTYGIIDKSWDIMGNKEEFFDTVYDYSEEKKEYPSNYQTLM